MKMETTIVYWNDGPSMYKHPYPKQPLNPNPKIQTQEALSPAKTLFLGCVNEPRHLWVRLLVVSPDSDWRSVKEMATAI